MGQQGTEWLYVVGEMTLWGNREQCGCTLLERRHCGATGSGVVVRCWRDDIVAQQGVVWLYVVGEMTLWRNRE